MSKLLILELFFVQKCFAKQKCFAMLSKSRKEIHATTYKPFNYSLYRQGISNQVSSDLSNQNSTRAEHFLLNHPPDGDGEGCQHVRGALAGAVVRRGGEPGGRRHPEGVPGAPAADAVLAADVARHERRQARQEALSPRTR